MTNGTNNLLAAGDYDIVLLEPGENVNFRSQVAEKFSLVASIAILSIYTTIYYVSSSTSTQQLVTNSFCTTPSPWFHPRWFTVLTPVQNVTKAGVVWTRIALLGSSPSLLLSVDSPHPSHSRAIARTVGDEDVPVKQRQCRGRGRGVAQFIVSRDFVEYPSRLLILICNLVSAYCPVDTQDQIQNVSLSNSLNCSAIVRSALWTNMRSWDGRGGGRSRWG